MTRRRTHEEFLLEVKNTHPDIIILGVYKNARTKIKCKCSVCGNEWDITPYDLLKGKGCYECTKKVMSNRLIKTTEQFIKELKEVNPYIEILSEYTGNKKPIKCRCLIDNHIWMSRPINLLRGHGCPICGTNKAKELTSKTHEEFIIELSTKNHNIEILSKYINMKTKVKCKCKICNCEWEAIPDNLLRDRGCPTCSSSKGERKIIEYLDNINIDYSHDIVYFKDLIGVNGGLLRPDFIIPSFKIWIEYDGIQHFEPKDFANKGEEWAKEMLILTQSNDKLKDEYANKHGWKLIRIPYWEYNNIENILDEILNKSNEVK